MDVGQAVIDCLERDSSTSGIETALGMFCDHLDVDRVSLHAIDRDAGTFRVVAGGGGELLAAGTSLPLQESTQVHVPAEGAIFRSRRLADEESFDRPLDRLVLDMGYTAGCSLPLFMGSRPVGVLGASSRSTDFEPDPVLDAMSDASLAMTLALRRVHDDDAHVLVCLTDELLAQGVARLVEHELPATVQTCSSQGALDAAVDRHYRAIICDARFDGLAVDDLLSSLRARGAEGPALVLATNDSPMSRTLARRGGAEAYVARSTGAGAVVLALRNLLAGEPDGVRIETVGDDVDIPQLTCQEARVLVLLDRGLRFKQIALELCISESTAKGYARNVFTKLGAHSRGEAVHEARKRGLLDFLSQTA
jgi:DNA-binding NarL/FixJ family response regulator